MACRTSASPGESKRRGQEGKKGGKRNFFDQSLLKCGIPPTEGEKR